MKQTINKQLNIFILLLGFLALAATAFVQGLWLLLVQLLAIGCLMLGAYRFSLSRNESSTLNKDDDAHDKSV